MQKYHDKEFIKNNIRCCGNVTIPEKNFFIHFHNLGGGTSKYVYDIVNNYERCYIIWKKEHLDFIKSGDKIWLNHFIKTNITIDDIISIIKNNIDLYIVLHDMTWLCEDYYNHTENIHNIYINENDIEICDKVKIIFEVAKKIICPTKFIYNIYSKYFKNDNFMIINHNDYIIEKHISIYKKINKSIKICHPSSFTNYKGSRLINFLKKNFKNYKNYEIDFLICGHDLPNYNDTYNDFINMLNIYHINGLLFLNQYGETWGFSMTKGLKSCIPIIYNNIGSFKERINYCQENHVICYNNENELNNDNNLLIKSFQKFLDIIIENDINAIKIINDDIEHKIELNDKYDLFFCKKK